jgi:hypothetical protein
MLMRDDHVLPEYLIHVSLPQSAETRRTAVAATKVSDDFSPLLRPRIGDEQISGDSDVFAVSTAEYLAGIHNGAPFDRRFIKQSHQSGSNESIRNGLLQKQAIILSLEERIQSFRSASRMLRPGKANSTVY